MTFTVIGTSDDRRIERNVGREYAQGLAARVAETGETTIVRDDDGVVEDQVFEGAVLEADGIDHDTDAVEAPKASGRRSSKKADAPVDEGVEDA